MLVGGASNQASSSGMEGQRSTENLEREAFHKGNTCKDSRVMISKVMNEVYFGRSKRPPALGVAILSAIKSSGNNIQKEYTKSMPYRKQYVATSEIAQDAASCRCAIPYPKFSHSRDELIVFPKSPFSVTRLLRPADPVSRDPKPSSTGPALLVPLVDLSSTVSTLELSCESLVANISCARGTLQVRELCIKTVRKAKRG
jgi:hypothetical protein